MNNSSRRIDGLNRYIYGATDPTFTAVGRPGIVL